MQMDDDTLEQLAYLIDRLNEACREQGCRELDCKTEDIMAIGKHIETLSLHMNTKLAEERGKREFWKERAEFIRELT